jgi:hypothetical protein
MFALVLLFSGLVSF